MGARSSRLKYHEWDSDKLAQTSGLSRDEIDRLHIDFMKAAGSDGVLDIQEFIRFYTHFPGIEMQDTHNINQQARRIFQAFDRDNTNTLSFDEFLNVIVLINHTMPRYDRVEYLIRQNNIDKLKKNKGLILAEYGHQILRRLNDYYGSSAGKEHFYWKEIDTQNRGYVTEEEFMNYISNHADFNRK
ncbi:unnamed protein product [Adineta steineri]|uniref:EF-hand domain-containing protein n=2 Tax=Adineta steineri TaxID=433720 RepID=A0A820AD04_9BILA|nr:unnamed protein product [Adineta steineri]CAF4187356.1 unnamed protein product [Adineta steineri]